MDILNGLKKGAFLTTKNNGEVNTMTISWGTMGIEWGTDVFVTMVRDSRYTKKAIDETGMFTVTIPLDETMKDALAYCGTKSGRDYDKIKDCNLLLQDGKTIDVPVIKCRAIAIECKVLYSQRMAEESMSLKFKEKFYNTGDIHTLYHGEILSMYEV